MKKVCFLFAIMLMAMSACQTLPSPKSNIVIVNYASLIDQGIFVTESNSVSFSYEPVSSISIDELGGWVRKEKKSTIRKELNDDYYLDTMNPYGGKKVYKAPDMNDMFNKLAIELQEMGANGIINLKIIQTFEYQKEIKQFIHRVTISGMAIKK